MLVDGQIAEFVDDEQSRLEIFVQFAFQFAMGVSRAERVDDIDRGGKEHWVAAQTGGMPEGDTQMGFTQTDVGNEVILPRFDGHFIVVKMKEVRDGKDESVVRGGI